MMNRLNLAWLLATVGLLRPFPGHAWQQGRAGDPSAELRDAVAALERGEFQTAEKKLRDEVTAHPDNAWALSLLGAALDNLKRIPEADGFHRRAITQAPRSTEVLNNYAAHLWIAGDEREAAMVYRQVVAIDPAHYNANLQLARLALKERNGPETLRCLDRLPASQRENPQVLLPRLEALYLGGERAQADALAVRLLEMARADWNLGFAAGMALSNVEQFGKAETFFENTLKGDPANFSVLYDLGIAATRAGHYERAREVLEAALRQQPQNVDALYALGCADHASKQWETAVHLLSQAAKLDPRRADIQKMLALATTDLGALDDAAAAWDRYLKLEPNDEIARRERGYTAAQMGQLEQGIADLEWYVGKRPDDAVGHYELGQADRSVDIGKAMDHFDKALALDPNYVPARTARGSLYYQQAKPEAAVKDLEVAASLRPDDAASLDRLGQTYQALDRSADAVRVLRKAAQLAPDDSKTLLHFARALADAGNTEESRNVMDRFRQIGPEKRTGVRAGFVEYLSLTEVERHADYRARLEKAVRNHPNDAALQVDYLKLLLADGDGNRVAAVAHGIAGMKPGAALLGEAGHALLATKQYGLADQLLKQAEAEGPSAAIDLDLAIATFRQGDSAKGLELLEHIPESARNGDYYLSRAEMLEASGKSQDALRDLQQALGTDPQRPDLYQRAAALLLGKRRTPDAARLLDQAVRMLPKNREILLMQATVAELAGKSDEAEHSLVEIQNRWPEWQPVWTAHGMILSIHRHFEEGRKALETAVALGAAGPEVYFYLAGCALRSVAGGPSSGREAAEVAIGKALQQAPEDAWIQALAGRIALERGNYALSLERLRESIRLRPGSVEAHSDLARAYRASGRTPEAQSEMEKVRRLEENASGAVDDPPYLFSLVVAGAEASTVTKGSR
ncbi:MAG: tetratricopeptide repeat protein [Acidobacteriia bacterium]|nr:tetratricopeptide repeat protein [Terriglobia bacterium]